MIKLNLKHIKLKLQLIMPFIKFGKTTIIFLPDRQSSEGALAICGYLAFLVTIITLVISPVCGLFVFITSLFNNLLIQFIEPIM
ncbi:hypothetical protein NIES3807_00040 [Microcystis aeruginosa NIES-3807]|uniref:Uncharacterized protein n=1 Tax=Microcystis aeruginosa NIES-3807 TaxID=2517785 RepID=A0AAD3G7D9_MICAE|nr:hypothetical protein NIES3807_00040 [Microcystis aeruginosa NIES-3807]